MKPRTTLIMNSAAFFIISPLLGIMVAGIVVGVLEAVIWTIVGITGLISSIFFDVDFASVKSRMPVIRQIEMWLIFGGGTLGGIIWSCLEVREGWQKYNATGKGW